MSTHRSPCPVNGPHGVGVVLIWKTRVGGVPREEGDSEFRHGS